MTVLAAAGTAAVIVLTSSAETSAAMINRRQAFYACDGVGRAAMVRARDYLRRDTTPTTTELRTAVCGASSGCPSKSDFAPTGFTIDTLDLATAGLQTCTSNGQCASASCQGGFCVPVLPLPNGPFRGMNARQTDLSIIIEATKDATDARCRVEENLALGEIGLFQFFVFANGYTDLGIPPTMNINGRVHVNGDFCAWGNPGNLKIDTVTASERLLTGSHCPRYAVGGGAGQNYAILDAATAGTTNTYREITDSNDATCVACTPTPGSGAWTQYAMAHWNGNAQDGSHGVPVLRLPVVGSTAVQDGRDVSANAVDNSDSLRMLVDPVRPGDSASVLAQRYASKADIVIVNGIWFKRTSGVPWPGTPIWSDHPGNYTPSCLNDEGAVLCAAGAALGDVGQAALFSGTKPSRYSYYRHGATGELAPDYAQRPVVSYGPIFRNAANDFRPAYYTVDPGTGAVGTAPAQTTNAAQAIEGTRAGFKDFRVDAGLAGANTEDMILPMNFDLAAFTAALQDNDPGELGSHFSDFNGIIYIVNTWPGWDDNMSTSPAPNPVPALWPRVDDAGGAATAGLVAPTGAGSTRVNTRLPYHLCKTAGTANLLNDGPTAGPAALVAPDCSNALTRPSALRIINGATVNPTVFPAGLSIVSNSGVYIVGDLNSASGSFVGAGAVPMIVPVETVAPFATWRPLMVGGDAVTLLSNNWNDQHADWQDPRDSAQRDLRVPTTTMWAFASISGSVETSMTASSGGLNNFPRFLEKWSGSGAATRIFGSLVVGFRSVYQWQRFPQPFTGYGVNDQFAYTAPTRQWVYDTNFNMPSNQPPGTPSFFVQAVKTWKRE
ncbi:MAG: hypothetical protein IT383_23775 [Deltaproteobacteria bacterium]|nr:hypothetical protein [Deltaproteobacteria bacterium]